MSRMIQLIIAFSHVAVTNFRCEDHFYNYHDQEISKKNQVKRISIPHCHYLQNKKALGCRQGVFKKFIFGGDSFTSFLSKST